MIRILHLSDKSLPEGTRVVMFGGGFPEMFAAELTANREMRQAIKDFAGSDGFIYVECGGFMYLGESLTNRAAGAVKNSVASISRMFLPATSTSILSPRPK